MGLFYLRVVSRVTFDATTIQALRAMQSIFSMIKKTTLGALLVSFAAMLWGLDGVALTPRLYNLDVSYVVFMLHALPFLAMNLILFREYKHIKTLRPSEMIYFFLIALFGGALGTLAIVKALFLVEFKALTVVALLQKLQPVFAVVLARILLKERFNKNFLFWAVVALCASYFLTFEFHRPELALGGKMLPAAFYAILAAFSFGSATVFGKRVLNKVPFQTALFFRYGLTSLIMLAIVVANGNMAQFSQTTPMNWAFFALIGATTGSGAILLYYYGLRYITANVSTMCELWFVVSTILFDFLLNGHVLSPIQWISSGTMLIAIYMITMNQPEATEQVSDSVLCEA